MMRLKGKWMMGLVLAASLMVSSLAEASVLLNEIFADPALDLTGDANRDGIRSGTEDEFIEILNDDDVSADISGWSLTDAVSVRHIFPANTILSPYTFLVVFGGGSPLLTDVNWQTASSGGLGLNNTSDIVSLFDLESQLRDSVSYGAAAGNDQSIALFPDGVGTEFFLHSSLSQAQGALFSPGTSVDGRLSLATFEEQNPISNAVVPELSSLIYLGMGLGTLLLKRK